MQSSISTKAVEFFETPHPNQASNENLLDSTVPLFEPEPLLRLTMSCMSSKPSLLTTYISFLFLSLHWRSPILNSTYNPSAYKPPSHHGSIWSTTHIVEHVFSGPVVSSDGHVLLVHDLGVVQVLHRRVGGEDEGQAAPHAVRGHPVDERS